MPVSGAWRVSYSHYSVVESGDDNNTVIYLNGRNLGASSVHHTYTSTGMVNTTSGRVVILRASAGDTIELRTGTMEGHYNDISFCVEYIPKM